MLSDFIVLIDIGSGLAVIFATIFFFLVFIFATLLTALSTSGFSFFFRIAKKNITRSFSFFISISVAIIMVPLSLYFILFLGEYFGATFLVALGPVMIMLPAASICELVRLRRKWGLNRDTLVQITFFLLSWLAAIFWARTLFFEEDEARLMFLCLQLLVGFLFLLVFIAAYKSRCLRPIRDAMDERKAAEVAGDRHPVHAWLAVQNKLNV